MKGEAKLIFSMILFLGLLILLTGSSTLFVINLRQESNVTSDENITFINNPNDLAPKKCEFQQGFPIIDFVSYSADCIIKQVEFFFSFSDISTSITWLSVIFVAFISTLLYIGFRLLRGGG